MSKVFLRINTSFLFFIRIEKQRACWEMKVSPGGKISFVAISQKHAQVTGSESPQTATSDDPLDVVTAEWYGILKRTGFLVKKKVNNIFFILIRYKKGPNSRQRQTANAASRNGWVWRLSDGRNNLHAWIDLQFTAADGMACAAGWRARSQEWDEMHFCCRINNNNKMKTKERNISTLLQEDEDSCSSAKS